METSHRRYNPLTESWVLVSPHRANRPWQGQVEKIPIPTTKPYDSSCYLCPTNKRIGDILNPNYESVFVFENDFAALLKESGEKKSRNKVRDRETAVFFRAKEERGICKVICFSPRHDLTIPQMSIDAIRKIIDVWCAEYEDLGKKPFIKYVQIFENKGAIMGCSNPHPHGQIWAQSAIPDEPLKKQKAQAKYFRKYKKTLIFDYLQEEIKVNERILFENEYFVALVPFWATWPFEAMIVPKRAVARITDFTAAEKEAFAAAYQQMTILYDNLFEVSFPYSAGIHQAPTDGKLHPEWHLHFIFYPPLLRSATVKKFMVGYEMLANPQRDISPEKAANILKHLPKTHYKNK